MMELNRRWLENKDEVTFKSSVYIPVQNKDISTVFKQVYDRKKFYKWFNFFPVLWINFSREQLKVGCIGTIYFTLPLFYYKLMVVKVIPDKSIMLEGVRGPMKGKAYFNFRFTKGGIILENSHTLTGRNRWLHLYFVYFLLPFHAPFMAWRYSVLKRNVRKEVRKGKGVKV